LDPITASGILLTLGIFLRQEVKGRMQNDDDNLIRDYIEFVRRSDNEVLVRLILDSKEEIMQTISQQELLIANIQKSLKKHSEYNKIVERKIDKIHELVVSSSVLSSTPLRNFQLSLPLIGREQILSKLDNIAGDVLISEQPGTGKSFLLYHYIKDKDGKFVISDNPDYIMSTLSISCPPILIIDDAAEKSDLINRLKHFRMESGKYFRIFATCWPYDIEKVQEALSVGKAQTMSLPKLKREEVVQVIRHMGVNGPNNLLHEIIGQSAGRIGLTVTLCELLKNGSHIDVFNGKAILRHFKSKYYGSKSGEIFAILATVAVGGRAGITDIAIMDFLGINKLQLSSTLTQLATGGIIKQGSRGELIIVPQFLGIALVGEYFWGKNSIFSKNDYCVLFHKVISPSEAYYILLESHHRGGTVPNQLLRELLLTINEYDCKKLWCELAYSSSENASWIYNNHPKHFWGCINGLLYRIPEVVLPKLLDESDYPRTNQGVSDIECWIKELTKQNDNGVNQRIALIKTSLQWATNTQNHKLLFKMIAIAMKLNINLSEQSVANLDSFSFYSYLYPSKSAELLFNSTWSRVFNYIKENVDSIEDWSSLTSIIHSWSHPHAMNMPSNSDATIYKKISMKMILDLFSIAPIGLRSKLVELGHNLKLNLSSGNEEFVTLFPREDYYKNYERQYDKWHANAVKMTQKWQLEDTDKVTTKVINFENEATKAGVAHPRMTRIVFEHIAKHDKERRVEWYSHLLEKRCKYDLLTPFLDELEHDLSVTKFTIIIRGLLQIEDYKTTALEYCLTADKVSEELFEEMIPEFKKCPSVLTYRGKASITRTLKLLTCDYPEVRVSVAIGEFGIIGSTFRKELSSAWRKVIINDFGQNEKLIEDNSYLLPRMFEFDKTLAYEWLKNNINTSSIFDSLSATRKKDFAKMFNFCSLEQRKKLAKIVSSEYSGRVVQVLVAGDTEVYEVILQREDLSNWIKEAPLKGSPNTYNWPQKVETALRYQFPVKAIMSACIPLSFSWCGNPSETLKGKLDEFKKIHKQLNDGAVKNIVNDVIREYTNQYESQLKKEHEAEYEW